MRNGLLSYVTFLFLYPGDAARSTKSCPRPVAAPQHCATPWDTSRHHHTRPKRDPRSPPPPPGPQAARRRPERARGAPSTALGGPCAAPSAAHKLPAHLRAAHAARRAAQARRGRRGWAVGPWWDRGACGGRAGRGVQVGRWGWGSAHISPGTLGGLVDPPGGGTGRPAPPSSGSTPAARQLRRQLGDLL